MSTACHSAGQRGDPFVVRILVVDDEASIRRLLRLGLKRHGYEVLDAENGRQGLEAMALGPDLTILDLDLPDIEGLEVLRIMRRSGEMLPVIILSGRDSEDDKVRAFDLGAYDYVVKPFGMNELLARIRKALRHRLQARGERPVFAIGDLKVDLVQRIVSVNGVTIDLTSKEYQLLRFLVRHAGEALTYAAILEEVWTPQTKRTYLHAYIRQLRRKIGPDRWRTNPIETIASVGYRLRVEERGET